MGADMREIVDAEQVGRLFAVLAVALPPIALLCGWLLGRRRNSSRRGAMYGLLAGLIGPLNWVLWRTYNAITDALGLDTVRNLVINLVLFLIVGALTGLVVGLVLRRAQPPAEGESPADHAP